MIAALLLAAGAAQPALPVLHSAGEVKAVLAESASDVVVLHFWATWCVPCRAEWPALGKLLGKYRKKVRVVSLSLDPREKAASVRRFLREVSAPRHDAFLLDADAGPVVEMIDPAWDAELPATFVFAAGRRTATHLGRADLAALREDLDRALALVGGPRRD